MTNEIMKVLVVDVGGHSVKILATGQNEPRKHPCGPTLTAEQMVAGVKRKQLPAAKSASSIAPKTAFGIRFRSLVVRLMRRLPFVVDFFISRELRDQVELPDYGF